MDYVKKLQDANIRIDHVWHLTGAISVGCIPPGLEDVLESDSDDIGKAVGLDIDGYDGDEICELLYDAKKTGFLIQASTPVPNFVEGHSGYSFNWSTYTYHWFYADTISEAYDKAIKWAEKYRDTKRAAQLAA